MTTLWQFARSGGLFSKAGCIHDCHLLSRCADDVRNKSSKRHRNGNRLPVRVFFALTMRNMLCRDGGKAGLPELR